MDRRCFHHQISVLIISVFYRERVNRAVVHSDRPGILRLDQLTVLVIGVGSPVLIRVVGVIFPRQPVFRVILVKGLGCAGHFSAAVIGIAGFADLISLRVICIFLTRLQLIPCIVVQNLEHITGSIIIGFMKAIITLRVRGDIDQSFIDRPFGILRFVCVFVIIDHAGAAVLDKRAARYVSLGIVGIEKLRVPIKFIRCGVSSPTVFLRQDAVRIIGVERVPFQVIICVLALLGFQIHRFRMRRNAGNRQKRKRHQQGERDAENASFHFASSFISRDRGTGT